MDLAAGSRQLWALMEHTTKDGRPRLVQRCNYPLTASGVVKRVYTNLAVLEVTPRGFEVLDMAPGLTLDALQSKTDAKLHQPAKAASVRAAPQRQERAPQPWDPLSIVPKR
jgi:3-oxoadipate CoA-transferase beta subunit